jgi:hypothetical protein
MDGRAFAAAAAAATAVLCIACGPVAALLEPQPEPEPEVQPAAKTAAATAAATAQSAALSLPPLAAPADVAAAAADRPWPPADWPPTMPPPGVAIVPLPCRGDTADVVAAASAFNELGLVIAKSLLPPEFAAECCAHAQEAFDDLMCQFRKRGVTIGEKTKGGFKEIVKRTSGRYEMLYRMDEGIFENKPCSTGRLAKVLETSWLKEFLEQTLGTTFQHVSPICLLYLRISDDKMLQMGR